MNFLSVPRIQLTDEHDINQVAAIFKKLPCNHLNTVPWPEYSYQPEVQFCVAHNGDSIFLQFHVREADVRATVSETNGRVWEDSCVEFFIAFDDAGYYNLECNAIGTMHGAFGKDRYHRIWLEEPEIQAIRRQAVILRDGADTVWTMTMLLPVTLFVYHEILSFNGKKARANFYKCGDKLPQPHYLAWNLLEAPEPDFHLPQYFGTLQFES